MGEMRELRLKTSGISRQSMQGCLSGVVVGVRSVWAATRSETEKAARLVERIELTLIQRSVLTHHGRLVKITADGFVAIFDRPVDAARCSIVIQQGMAERNQSLPERPPIDYRIGVNLGDVITDLNDLHGEGVHVASCLAAIAAPGQICVSGGIYEQIKHRLFYGYVSLGDRNVENIPGPVTVYRMFSDPKGFHRIRRKREIILVCLLSLALLIIASSGVWFLYDQLDSNGAAAEGPSRPDRVSLGQNLLRVRKRS